MNSDEDAPDHVTAHHSKRQRRRHAPKQTHAEPMDEEPDFLPRSVGRKLTSGTTAIYIDHSFG